MNAADAPDATRLADAPGAAAPPGARLPVVLLTVLLVAVLMAAGRLGRLMAVGSTGITPVWLPAGIALAAVMLHRGRAVPGVALAALIEGLVDAGPAATWRSRDVFEPALGVAIVGVVEIVGAAWALRGLTATMRAHPVAATLRFVAVACAAALFAAIAGPAVLLLSAPERFGDLAFTALTWWIGDATGLLVLTPPLLLAWHPVLRIDRIAVQAFPTICLGLGFTLFATFASSVQGREARLLRFEAETARLAAALGNHAEMAARDLETLQHVFRRVPIDRDEFRSIAAPMLDRSPWQTTFGWLPRVSDAERASFETRADGLDGASIRELESDGALVRAGTRPDYFPLAWTAPQFGREALIGVDNAFDPLRGPALAHARDTGRISITAPLASLANSTDERLVQVMVAPLVPVGERVTEPHRAREVAGMLSATIDLERLLQAALVQRDVTGERVLLFDPTASGAALRWDDAQHVSVLDAPALREALAQMTAGVHKRLDVPVADRHWMLVCRPSWAGTLPGLGWVQGAVVGSGLAFTALLTGFLVVRRRRDEALMQARTQLEDQVAARTTDLASTNAKLLSEIDDHRRTEHLLQEARTRAESASRAKSLFLANMSHEIRTPLNAVLGYTQLLLEDRRQPGDARERLHVIRAAGNRLLGLINDVLDLAKIEAGGLQLNEEPLDLKQELTDMATLFAPRAAEKALALRVDLDLDGSPIVRGDRAKLGQIVLNLLGNALKFTEHGSITLAAWRVGERVLVEVADTGPGMEAAEVDGLFQPFRQGSAGRDKGGTGLGLTLSRNLAQAMGGELDVSSVPGEGTRVRLSLPMEEADEAPLQAATFLGRQRLHASTPCRALVVEDDLHSREVLATLLSQAGCQVTVALDGREGLDACRPAAADGSDAPPPFDIVFSDIRMPRLDGLQMMRVLRGDARTAGLPLIAVSASSLEHQRRDYIAQGFDDFVSKPYAFDEIYTMLVRHAGVRLEPADDDEPSVDAPATGGAPAVAAAEATHDEAWRLRLGAIREAAAAGAMHGVRRGLAALAPGDLAPAQFQLLEVDLKRYDFDALEARLDAWLDDDGATGKG